MSEMEAYQLETEDVLEQYQTSVDGLSKEEAKKRLETHGENVLIEHDGITPFQIFVNQFKDLMVIILLIAALLSFFLGETIDAIVIGIIVILNSVLGFIQEFKAEKAIEALKEFSSPIAFVIRAGRGREIPSKYVVPGDVIELEMGNKIPSDGRLIEVINFRADESILTGESTDVTKKTEPIDSKSSLGDLKNSVFMGTIVTYGRCRYVTTKTGMDTEIGKISDMVAKAPDPPTPLEKQLHSLSKTLGLIIIFVSVLIFVLEIGVKVVHLDIITPNDLVDNFIIAVSLAVSAIPEGLPAIVTASLALGTQQMAKRKAIVRKLASVQTLGSTTVIVSDKTGTLTKNEMTVRNVSSLNSDVFVTGEGYLPIGEFLIDNKPVNIEKDLAIKGIILTGLLCNTSSLILEENRWMIHGDPTEGALLVLAEKAKITEIKNTLIFDNEIPFDSKRKMMSIIYEKEGVRKAYVKGAPEIILDRCTHILDNGEKRKITDQDKKSIIRKFQNMANQALRTLLFAERQLKENEREYTSEKIEKDLTCLGIVGMIDPPRDEVKSSIELCEKAGIKVIMNTGDHKSTAVAIAREIGLYKPTEEVLTGKEIDKLNDPELDRMINYVTVCARVSPSHKVRVLQSLKRVGHIVAMTGDGVNDAPALKNADIGISMGINGTDVAKEASDMILLDDNFSTIVNAVEEGRAIFDNIKKFIRYLLSANFDELLVVAVAALLYLPIPFVPVQILWINLVTDGMPALALTMDPKDSGIMDKPPEKTTGKILRNIMVFSFIAGFLAFVATFSLFYFEYVMIGGSPPGDSDILIRARTIAFTTSMLFEMFLVFTIRSETETMFHKKSFNNKYLLLAVGVSLILQLMVIYVPFLQVIFHTTALTLHEWLLIGGITFALVTLADFGKVFVYKRSRKKDRNEL
ncbi:MAG: calcium-translocating P-type ATPase, SERCA-type [Candidatus Ranarchaeia archaeon]